MNRYYQSVRLQQNIKPLEVDFNMIAAPLLQKQQAYNTALETGYALLENLKANPLYPNQVEYAKQKKEEIQNFLNEYERQDLSNPMIRKKMTMGVKQLMDDPAIAGMNKDYEDYTKKMEFLQKMEMEGEPVRDYNQAAFVMGVKKGMENGYTKDQWGKTIQSVYGNVDRAAEAEKVLKVIGADGWEDIYYDPDLGGWWKRGVKGKSAAKMDAGAAQVLDMYMSNTQQDYENEYNYLNPVDAKTQKAIPFNDFVLNDLRKFAAAYQTQDVSRDFLGDYTNYLSEQGRIQSMAHPQIANSVLTDIQRPIIPTNSTAQTNADLIAGIDKEIADLSKSNKGFGVKGLMNAYRLSQLGQMRAELQLSENLGTYNKTVSPEDFFKKLDPETKKLVDRIVPEDDFVTPTSTYTGKKEINQAARLQALQEAHKNIPSGALSAPQRSSLTFLTTPEGKSQRLVNTMYTGDEAIASNAVRQLIPRVMVYDLAEGAVIPGQQLSDKIAKEDLAKTMKTHGIISADNPVAMLMKDENNNPVGGQFANAFEVEVGGKTYWVQQDLNQQSSATGLTAAATSMNTSDAQYVPTTYTKAWVASPTKTGQVQTQQVDEVKIKYDPNTATYTTKGTIRLELPNGGLITVPYDTESLLPEQQADPHAISADLNFLYSLGPVEGGVIKVSRYAGINSEQELDNARDANARDIVNYLTLPFQQTKR